jgi:hypothetical protein
MTYCILIINEVVDIYHLKLHHLTLYHLIHHFTPPHSSSSLLFTPPPHSSSSLLLLTSPPHSSSSLLLLTPPPQMKGSNGLYITTQFPSLLLQPWLDASLQL